jgi:hypothetical protein
MSLGTGCNWQIFGDGDNGIERKQVEGAIHGFLLEGTNLGAGFLMGFGKLLTDEKGYTSILAKLKDEEYR